MSEDSLTIEYNLCALRDLINTKASVDPLAEAIHGYGNELPGTQCWNPGLLTQSDTGCDVWVKHGWVVEILYSCITTSMSD